MASGKIIAHFRSQGVACGRLGSPFTERLCLTLADLFERGMGGRVARGVLDHAGEPGADALALRLCGGLNALRLSDDRLASIYPPEKPGADFETTIADALERRGDELLDWLDRPPQTNEVARSGVLIGGLLYLAERHGPLALYELGASAGLNQFPDRYAYDFGDDLRRPGGAVSIECAWEGRPAEVTHPLEITSRAGCDVAPLDAGDPDTRARMLAYIWPDQPQRCARAKAALDLVAGEGIRIERAGVADWLGSLTTHLVSCKAHPVIYHSIMWQYVPGSEQDRAIGHMRRIGAQRPLSWLRMEADDDHGTASVLLTRWPDGETVELGRGDFHGRWARWHDVPISLP